MLQAQPPPGAAVVSCPHHPAKGVWTVGSGSRRGLSVVGSGQQGVETIVCAGVIFLIVDVAVVVAGAGESSLVHKQ